MRVCIVDLTWEFMPMLYKDGLHQYRLWSALLFFWWRYVFSCLHICADKTAKLGPSALAGFALFLLVAPIQSQVMAHRLKIRKASNIFTDQRAKLLAEVFSKLVNICNLFSTNLGRHHAYCQVFLL